ARERGGRGQQRALPPPRPRGRATAREETGLFRIGDRRRPGPPRTAQPTRGRSPQRRGKEHRQLTGAGAARAVRSPPPRRSAPVRFAPPWRPFASKKRKAPTAP